MSVDCLIITTIPAELQSVLFQFRHFRPTSSAAGSRFPFFETTAPNGLKVVAGSPTSMGALGAASLTKEAITLFKPKSLLLVGITGGMDKDIPLGDVVVSEQIVDYELGKVTSEGFGPRWSVYRPDASLLAKAKAWPNQSWQNYIRSKRPTGSGQPVLHFGVILSGNKVIADEQTAGSLRSVWRKAAAIEMEAAGVASVLWHAENPPRLLVIKSVCDYADSAKNDDWHEYAADTAASCAFSFAIDHLSASDLREGAPRVEPTEREDERAARALRESLGLAYNLSELKVLCYDIGVDWEEIPQGPKSAMIVELLGYVRRRGMLGTLAAVVNRDRNDILGAYTDHIDA